MKLTYIVGLAASAKGLFEPSFANEPQTVIRAVVGETVNIDCNVDGATKQNPNFVQWVKGNLALGFPPLTKDRYEQSIGPADYSLKIENVQLTDEDQFECQITPFGLRSQVGKLEVITPPKTVDLTPAGKDVKIIKDGKREIIEVIEGVPTRLRCIATDSKPKTEITWSINDSELASSSSISGDLLLTTVSELTLIPKKSHHDQPISCFANNSALPEPIQQIAFLDVQTVPEVTVELETESVKEGETLRAKCNAMGNPPVQSYEWYLNGEILDSSSDSIEIENIPYQLDTENLKCVCQNKIGKGFGDVQLNIQYYPKMVGMETSIVANKSESFELICEAEGNPKPEITWSDSYGDIIATGSILTIEEVAYHHYGAYSCRAENSLGTAVTYMNLSVRGSPYIKSPPAQAAPYLNCDFVAEPRAELVEIIDLATDEVIFQNSNFQNSNSENEVKVKLEEGKYECRVTNELGVSSVAIQLEPTGLTAGGRIGIICAILIVLLVVILAAMIKLRFFAREHRIKLKSNEDDYEAQDNRMNQDISYPYPISAPIPNATHSHYTEKSRLSLLRSSDDEPISDTDQHHHLHQANQPNSHSEKVLMMVPSGQSDSGSTGRSAHDDGYGTESGSNQKVHTVSSDSSNSDYEVNVPSLIGEKESKICVIWDDDTTPYEPAKYKIHSNMSRARSVSHV